MITYIYTLSCPISGDVRYVGKSNNPKERFLKHNNSKDLTKKKIWINDLKLKNIKPILTIIGYVPKDNWKFFEKFYISKYRNLGCNLLNTSIGGEGLDNGNQTSFKGENSKKVVALYKNGDYFKSFNSIKESVEFVGNSHVWDVLVGKTKTCGGYIWIYESDYIKMNENDIKIKVKNIKNNGSILNGIKTRWKPGFKTWNKGKRKIDTSIILNIINNEDQKCPLSDSKITKILDSMGYNISRKSVQKYRENLGISNYKNRKIWKEKELELV